MGFLACACHSLWVKGYTLKFNYCGRAEGPELPLFGARALRGIYVRAEFLRNRGLDRPCIDALRPLPIYSAGLLRSLNSFPRTSSVTEDERKYTVAVCVWICMCRNKCSPDPSAGVCRRNTPFGERVDFFLADSYVCKAYCTVLHAWAVKHADSALRRSISVLAGSLTCKINVITRVITS